MSESFANWEQVTQDLQQLEALLEPTFAMLDDLAAIQHRFKDLTDTYGELKDQLAAAREEWAQLRTDATAVIQSGTTLQQDVRTAIEGIPDLFRTEQTHLHEHIVSWQREVDANLQQVQSMMQTTVEHAVADTKTAAAEWAQQLEQREQEFRGRTAALEADIRAAVEQLPDRIATTLTDLADKLAQLDQQITQQFADVDRQRSTLAQDIQAAHLQIRSNDQAIAERINALDELVGTVSTAVNTRIDQLAVENDGRHAEERTHTAQMRETFESQITALLEEFQAEREQRLVLQSHIGRLRWWLIVSTLFALAALGITASTFFF